MHLALYVVACCYLGLAIAQHYHEKTRFDRSTNDQMENVTKDYILQYKRPIIFSDFKTRIRAYKLESEGLCYLEKMKRYSKDLVAAVYLTDFEAWSIAGDKIMDFCTGKTMILMQESRPVPDHVDNPFYNELPNDEDNIFQNRKNNEISRPFKMRSKRRILKELRKKLDKHEPQSFVRRKREASPFIGRFRGQTQSQYLNSADGQKDGKAEAEATQQSSRAVVSGSSGMGQAQSMSSGSDGCEGCPEYNKIGNVPGSIQGILGSQQGHPTGSNTGAYPTGIISGPITTGNRPGTLTYPSGTQSEIIPSTIGNKKIPDRNYPINFVPGTQFSGIDTDTQSRRSQYGEIPPNTQIIGGRENVPRLQTSGEIIYPVGTPGVQGVAINPSGMSSGITRIPAGTYPATITGTTIPEGGLYASAIRPGTPQKTQIIGAKPEIQISGGTRSPLSTESSVNKQYTAGVSSPANQGTSSQVGGPDISRTQVAGTNVYPPGTQIVGGGIPDSQITRGNIYPPGTQIVGRRIPGTQIPGGNAYPTGTQIVGRRIPGTQIPGENTFPTGTPIVEGRIPDTQISGRNTYPPGTQIPGGNIYPPGTQIVTGGVPGTQIPGGNTYLPGTQIVSDRAPSTQILEGNAYSPGTQIVGGHIPGSQIIRGNIYPPGTQIVGSRIPSTRIPGGNVYYPNTQTVGSRVPSPQILGGSAYSPGTQIVASGVPGTQIPGGNTYPPGTQIVIGGVPGTQIPIGNTYPPGTQIVTGGVPGTQIPRGNTYLPGTQIVGVRAPGTQLSGENIYPPRIQVMERTKSDTQVPINASPATEIIGSRVPSTQLLGGNYLSNTKIEDCIPNTLISGGNIFPPGTQFVSGSTSGTQLSQVPLYSSGMQLAGGNLPGTQIRGETPFPPGTYFVGGSIPSQISDRIVYPPRIQTVVDSSLGTQIPGQRVYVPVTQTAEGGLPGTQVPRGSLYPPGTQTINSHNSGIQIPQGAFSQTTRDSTPGNKISGLVYLPNTQIPDGTAPGSEIPSRIAYPTDTQILGGSTPGTQIPNRIEYSPGTQVVGGNNVGTQIPGEISYPPSTQLRESGSIGTQLPVVGAYPPGSKIVTSDGPGMQLPQSNLYSPSTQLSAGSSGALTSGETSYPLNTQVSGGTISGVQITDGNVYPPGIPITGTGIPRNPMQGENVYPPGSQITGDNKLTNVPGIQIPGNSYIPVGTLNSQIPIGGIYPGEGDNRAPTITYTGNAPSTDGSTTTSGGSQKPILRGDIPGTVIYPGIQTSGPTQSGTSGSDIPTIVSGGRYSPSSTGEAIYPSSNINTGTPGQYPVITGSQNYPGGVVLVPNSRGTAPGSNVNFPEGSTGIISTGGQSQASNQPTNAVIGTDDGSDSQAMSSVKQGESGTLASASAEGKHGHGSAKSQVSGIYNGNGSFSAQAGTSDDTKSAQTQVSGGKEGAKSSAQGSGGLGKSQTQVQLDSDSGATSTNAQSNGWNHGTNSQVQASAKGGMADAQANGEGQTSSQAQIGFQPYINRNEKLEKLEKPFRGSGTASAQSGTFRGQSQSQLQGSFHYGISYSGAAQAGSGSGSTALRKPFNFTNSDPNLFKTFNLEESKKIETTSETVSKEQLEASGTSSRQTVIAITPRNTHLEKKNRPEQPQYDISNTDDEYEEYEDEDYADSEFLQPTSGSERTRQKMRLFTNTGYDINVKHEEKTDETDGLSLPGYIASTDKRKMTSVIGKKITHENNTAKNKTMIATKNPITVSKPSSDTRSLHSDRVGGIYYGGLKNSGVQEESSSPKTNFVSVSNSVTGKMDDKNLTKKYEHRYYTKSSTCGYFTFSCNVVYGSNGRRKICKPKMPTYSDGTPKC